MMWVAISILPVDIMCREVLKGYAVIPAAHVCGLHVVNLKILKHYYDFPSLNVVLPWLISSEAQQLKEINCH